MYVDLTSDSILCFIDWATRCYYGSGTDLYGFTCGPDWAREERRKVRSATRAFQSQADRTPEKSKIRLSFLDMVQKAQTRDERWTNGIANCKDDVIGDRGGQEGERKRSQPLLEQRGDGVATRK